MLAHGARGGFVGGSDNEIREGPPGQRSGSQKERFLLGGDAGLKTRRLGSLGVGCFVYTCHKLFSYNQRVRRFAVHVKHYSGFGPSASFWVTE